jgi:hypothetical protein
MTLKHVPQTFQVTILTSSEYRPSRCNESPRAWGLLQLSKVQHLEGKFHCVINKLLKKFSADFQLVRNKKRKLLLWVYNGVIYTLACFTNNYKLMLLITFHWGLHVRDNLSFKKLSNRYSVFRDVCSYVQETCTQRSCQIQYTCPPLNPNLDQFQVTSSQPNSLTRIYHYSTAYVLVSHWYLSATLSTHNLMFQNIGTLCMWANWMCKCI